MKIVSYNIQYGIGLDGAYDIGRIADAVRDADVIALQEVTRNNPRNGGRDMVAELRDALPQHFAAFGPNFEADMGSHVKDGRAVDVRLEFGNMLLTKMPILSSRNLLLPRSRTYGALNLQRGALEVLVETPLGPLRVYSVHLDHRGPQERERQIAFLRERIFNYALEGGAISGATEIGFPEPPHPDACLVMGDFNMLAGSPEYEMLAGRPDHSVGSTPTATLLIDAAAGRDGPEATTWVEPGSPQDASLHKRIDYIFTHGSLAGRVRRCWVDRDATGSDHLPLWAEIE